MTLTVMVNGLPGKMAEACCEEAVERGYQLYQYGLSGSSTGTKEFGNGQKIELKPREFHEDVLKELPKDVIVIDYTVPQAVRGNVQLYNKLSIPFVLGTTGFDGTRAELYALVTSTKAVIAPNMNKQIVAFQALMEYGAETFPGAFAGYDLSIKESHQKTKKDTSGTAKAVCGHIATLARNTTFNVDNIEKVRDETQAMTEMGVPEQFLDGHAFHTYTLKSPATTIQFQHNVCGRQPYAAGTIDACEFLQSKRRSSAAGGGNVYSMIDVLKCVRV